MTPEKTPPIFGEPRVFESYGDTPQGTRKRVKDLPKGVYIEYRPYLQCWYFVVMYGLRPVFEIFSPELEPGITQFEAAVRELKAAMDEIPMPIAVEEGTPNDH